MFGREIPPVGNGDFYIVGEAPGKHEDRLGAPFVGSSGNLLFRALAKYGVSRKECRIANRFWRRPPGNDIASAKKHPQWEEYGELVKEDIRQQKPKVILCLGAEALHLFFPDFNLSSIRGYWLEWEGIPLIATYHPAAVLRKFTLHFPFSRDLRKAVHRYRGIASILQEPTMFPNDETALLNLLREVREKGHYWALDIECRHKPEWQCHVVGIATEDGRCANAFPSPAIVQELKRTVEEAGDKCILHNAMFDITWLYGEFGIEFPVAPHDTMVMHHILLADQPKSLEFCASIYLDVPAWKHLSSVDVWVYNLLDCFITVQLFFVLERQLREMGWWEVYDKQKRQELLPACFMGYLGLRLNEGKRQEYIAEVQERMQSLEEELFKLSGEINLNSPAQLKKLLFETWKLPPVKHQGKLSVREDCIVQLRKKLTQKKNADKREWLGNYLQWKKLSSILSKELKVQPCPWTGRVHTTYNIAGTESARWSSSAPLWGGGTNLQNRSKEFRGMYLPALPGWMFITADYGGAEARIVAWRCNDEVAKEAFLSGTDIHKLTASMMFNVPMEEVTKELRQIGKRIRHAANYDMSWRKLAQIMDIPPSQARELLERYHRTYPKIREVFHEKTKALLMQQRYLVDAWGLPRVFTDRLDSADTWREAYSFYPQSTCTHTLNKALLTLWEQYKEDEEVALNLQIHDELVLIAPPHRVREVMQAMDQAMGISIPILDLERDVIEPLVLPREFKVGWNWGPYDKERNPLGLRELTDEEMQEWTVEYECKVRGISYGEVRRALEI